MTKAIVREVGRGFENHTDSVLNMDYILKAVRNKEIFAGILQLNLHARISHNVGKWIGKVKVEAGESE